MAIAKSSGSPPPSDIVSAVAAYDEFAPYYQLYSQARSSYLRKIEDIVISRAASVRSLLDAGAGDGIRSLRIGNGVSASKVVLIEPSAGMRAQFARAQGTDGVEVWPFSIAEMPNDAPQFELIVCLWNVLGHIHEAQERLLALSKLRTLLSPGAMLFLDVHHRYNGASYGWTKTFYRMVHDFFIRSGKNGDVLVSWQAGQRTIRTQGHVFTNAEMQQLFRSAGLRVVRRWVVNYENGAECRLPIFGHLLYQLATA